jgi:hypothetical protein
MADYPCAWPYQAAWGIEPAAPVQSTPSDAAGGNSPPAAVTHVPVHKCTLPARGGRGMGVMPDGITDASAGEQKVCRQPPDRVAGPGANT